ncbi:MAG TPA: ATP-binding protein [Verrucomicrobiae bacterium]|nr:ATP-binding protein [Verrucomicrobiae bacterium]
MKNPNTPIGKLTIVYITVLCLVILFVGMMTYVIVNFSLEAYGARMYQETVKTDTLENGPEAVRRVADVLIDRELDRLRSYILIFSGIAAVIAPFVAYYLARKYTEPAIRAQERQRQFISNAAHELRTPLALVTGELDLALRQSRSTEEYRVAIENSRNEILEINRLTDQLLLLGQLDEIKEVKREKVAISSLIQKLVNDKATVFESKNLQIELSIHSDVPVSLNTDLFSIAVMNLLDNAIKYASPGSTVKVSVSFDSMVQIVISNQTDYAPSSRELQRLSERFYRLNTARSRGFGLGLAITRTIIEKHEGTVRLSAQSKKFIAKITLKAARS